MNNPNAPSGGPPLRALAMVLIALAIVFGGLGAMSLSKSDADSSGTGAPSSSSAVAAPAPAKPSTPVAAPAPPPSPPPVIPTPASALPPSASSGPASVNHSIPVRVLNNSMVAGLAGKTAVQLSADGWTNASSGNYAGENLTKTTVFYGTSPGEREAALAIADELGAVAQQKGSGFSDPNPGVVVIVTGN
ncbi:LytR family transcriptional regulator [Nocardia panacis]|uniref:LytR family transcriptional regulator n=1 Tax=Nocardia panacis TaxID=2340916 RepID=A0A3A4KMX5_9NOCA|nr:LytR C-terminal domain-containing protein [Nocardia panacis]RJO76677.1 LytR family transcriptional regulator [Nocardia panacis]